MMMRKLLLLALSAAALQLQPAHGLNNGAARTPPLGWMTWQRYRCNTNCSADPHNCINEALVKRTATAMVAGGYKAAGYQYVSLDACWNTPGSSEADPQRFPSGIKSLAAFIHGLGLKLGIYTSVSSPPGCAGDYGLSCVLENLTTTPPCTHAKQVLEKWVSWNIDSIKVDGCLANQVNRPKEKGPLGDAQLNLSYITVGNHLRDAVKQRGTGPVLYHPSGWSFVYPVPIFWPIVFSAHASQSRDMY